ncbi:MAG: hypothetical protein P1S60_20525, partial [Anaerolineae bacterium]|nr:hypothetical protein [Anaerolineae bacterium]
MEHVFPQTLYPLGIPIRDTVISTWFMVAFILIGVVLLRKFLPELLVQLVEFVEGVAKDYIPKKDVSRFVPFLGALVIFIAVANILGVIPLLQTP